MLSESLSVVGVQMLPHCKMCFTTLYKQYGITNAFGRKTLAASIRIYVCVRLTYNKGLGLHRDGGTARRFRFSWIFLENKIVQELSTENVIPWQRVRKERKKKQMAIV